MAALGDLPILQDTVADDVWGSWSAVWRDLVVLDDDNERSGLINLTAHDLALEENRDLVKALVLEAAARP